MAQADFKDHFSGHANLYQKYRPAYSKAVAQYCASLTPDRLCAWDAATGNGQLAVHLAEFFDEVVATDASSEQIERATPHAKVRYRIEPAEQSSLAAQSVSLITVAQAAHWFDAPRFEAEVRKVALPNAAIVYLAYDLFDDPEHPDFASVMRWFYTEVVGPYWPPERHYFDDGYRRVPFPFVEHEAPSLCLWASWTRDDAIGYVRSWSSTQRYQKATGRDPIDLLVPRLCSVWPDPTSARKLAWQLFLRVGRVA